MVLVGVFAVLAAVLFLWRGYSAYLTEQHHCDREMYAAICDIREKTAGYLATPREWASVYKSALLSKCGFLGVLEEGGSFCEAYEGARQCLNISCDSDEILSALFSLLGEGELQAELSRLDAAIDRMSRLTDGRGEEIAKRKKIAGALLGAVSACAVILLI